MVASSPFVARAGGRVPSPLRTLAYAAKIAAKRAAEPALKRIGALGRDPSGTGIVEFSLIVPTMLLIYCALGELASALELSRKVGSYTRTVADLTGRAKVDNAGLNAMFDAAAVVLQPFDASKAKITLSAMGVYKVGNTYYSVVCSSAARNTTPRPRFDFAKYASTGNKNGAGIAPKGYEYNGARYIVAEVQMPYTPVLGAAFFKWINKPNAIVFNERLAWPERPIDEIVMPGGEDCP